MAGKDVVAERRKELERRLAALSAEKRAQLDRSTADGVGRARAGITPRAPGAVVPMSFAQELLWLLDRANPGMHGYNVPRMARLRGALDETALQQALDGIVARHEVLRSTFDMVDGEPRQIVHPPRSVVVERVDLRDHPEETRERSAVALVQELSRRPFDLTVDAQLRVTLVQLGDDDHVLLLESHHVASDAWSRNILMRELSELYDAARQGRASSLPPMSVQYGDFAIWQRNTLQGERLEQLLNYWKTQLGGAPALLEIPTDRPRALVPSFEGGVRSRLLSRTLLDRLRAISQAEGTTLFMTLLAAFDVLLSRYSGQDDIVVGSPIAGRAHEGSEGLIGYFANTLVLRTRLDGDPTFTQLVGRVRETALGAYDHQDVPYEKLVLELQRDRALGRASLFQVMFTLQDAELRALQLPGLTMESFGAGRGATKFDLSLFMHEQAGGLRATLEYRTDLFDAATIDRMLGHLEVLLEGIAADPATPLSKLPMLPADERHTLLDVWSTGPAQSVDAETLHEFIEQQVARTPDAIAVEIETEDGTLDRLAFAELDRRASLLGRYLRDLGVGPDICVAICAERSTPLVVAILGVLKAGGYYLPLDPEYPADRLAFMVEDANVPVLLTMENVRDAVPPASQGSGPTVVFLDSDWSKIERAADVAERTDVARPNGDHLAYVIYTSGSTGRPKGVMIPHHAVVNYLTWMRNAYPLGVGDAVLQKAPASFDACIWEFFLPLVSGAKLVLARPGGHQDPVYLLSTLERHDITLLQLVPSQLQMMLETAGADAPNGLPRLRRLFLGGEALPSELLTRLAAACPRLPVTNLYGPTEATVYATHWSVMPDAWKGGVVPIGTPISNASIYLLDTARQPVGVGIPGELCIGGVGLARGYLNRAELTAEKFITNPLDPTGQTRLYRTGDRARYRADGTLEYMGRIDTQVKLRGFRVELGEIETALVSQDVVQSAVVLVREDTPGDQRLVAYCIPATPIDDRSADRSAVVAQLRDHLKGTLPEYMVPTAFVWLDEWPLNANGKLDRKALPAPDAADAAIVTEYVAPRTATESVIADIWGSVLQRQVGVNDDFFELGGHSLLALRILSRVAEHFKVRVPLRVMFEASTVAQFADRVDAMMTSAANRHALVSIPRRTSDSAPLSYAQEMLWVLQRAAPDLAAYNVAEQWRINGTIDVVALQRAFDALVERHELLRTTFTEQNGEPVQRITPPVMMPLEVFDLTGSSRADAEREAAKLTKERVRAPFDLSRDLLLRATLIRIAADDQLLVLVSHHIAYDGWSRGVLLRDLTAFYEEARTGVMAPLPPLPLRFADYAAWQRETLRGEALDAQLAYWQEQLGGHDAALNLPTDRPRPASPGFEGAKRTVVFPLELMQAVRRLAQTHDATPFVVLLAAFQTLLHRYSGQSDVAVATVVAGRDRPELEPIVGYFANTLALRASFEDDPSFTQVIERVLSAHLGASEHAAVPFEMLSRGGDGAGSVGGLPQVMFVLQNNAPAALKLGDAELRASGVEGGTAKFDLFLSMGEMSTGLRATLQYRTELFDEETIERLLGHLRALLESAIRTPAQAVSTLSILPADERHQLLVDWNATPEDFPRSATMYDLFARQAAATPDRTAVVHGTETVTYAQLERKATVLANVLRARGVVPGTFVGVCMDRSIDMVAAMLAVFQAGGAYVPLDPDYPEDRIAFMLEDTQARVVLTQRSVVHRLPALPILAAANGGRDAMVLLEPGWESALEIAESPTRAASRGASASDLAYIIYTSGSTGRPKGVMIEHRNAVAFITWARGVFTPNELAGVLASTSICFDLSIFELFVPLSTGGSVIVAQNALALPNVSNVVPVTLVNTVPSAAAELVRINGIPSSVRTINLAGELLAQRLVDALYDIPSVERVYDLYGPSEDTTYSTYVLRERGGRPTIGRPIANTRAYVLDRHGEPVPVGIPGELHIAGAGLARGYLHREDLTAERFVRDPFADAPDARMYRTGDLVRYLRDGRIEYLGRLDHQVKLRGFRIELGEIESVVAKVPGVTEALAVVREVSPGDTRLLLYVTGLSADVAQIRDAMRKALPQYMMPSAIVTLGAFPRTQNGKIDRKALPVPDAAPAEGTPFVAPSTPTEERIAAIWIDVLRAERIGVRDNFFELGGHSLIAMRIVSRVQEAFDVRLPLNAIFEWPTIAQLATAVDEKRQQGGPAATAEPGITRAARVGARRQTRSVPSDGGGHQ